MVHKRLRIAMLGLRGLGTSGQGGVERHVEELATRMAGKGHDVTVFCRTRYNPEGNRAYAGLRLVNKPAIYSKHLEAISNTAMIMPSVLWGYDIVHFHATGPSLLSWVPRLFRQKAVVTVHGLDFMRAKWGGLASAVLKAGAWTAINCPNATIVVSRTLQKYYKDTAGKDSYWVPNGVSEPVLRPLDALKRFGLEPGRYILSLGRLVPEKGIHYLINAFRALETDLKLVIAGGGMLDNSYERELREMAAGDERIIFTGPLYGPDKDEAFSNAELFVLPSDLEGMPIAMLEAMSYGCPLLSSDIPECAEIFTDVKISSEKPICASFSAADIYSLQESIKSLLTREDLAQMGQRGREYILKEYQWDKIADETLNVYKGLTKN